MAPPDPFRVEQLDLLYVGSATSLRGRLKAHLTDGSSASSFRSTLGALLSGSLALEVERRPSRPFYGFGGAGEGRLTRWIGQNTAVAVWPCADAGQAVQLERSLIRNVPAMLNIENRRRTDWGRSLLALRTPHGGS
jgi:hypothetical protein